jgi:hypothetical protein
MNVKRKPKIVLLGMMSRIPVAGNIWLVVHYMVGLRRLGYDPYYVEAHARTPSMLMEHDDDDSSLLAASFIGGVMKRFDFGDRWAFHALHDDGRCFGLSELELSQLYATADLIVNLHGGTKPQPEHLATDRLIFLETDPVELEIELHHGDQSAIDFLAPHRAFFTWGENYGNPDCRVPVPDGLVVHPTRAPVVLDFWDVNRPTGGAFFTTIGNWKQAWREVKFEGDVYYWSKHFEFMKIIDLPDRTDQAFELALSSCDEKAKQLLEEHRWRVVPAMDFSADLDAYRDYIAESRGECTVAKDQNIRLRSGWFSERSAQYLAAGRPVITQETGFSNALPTGKGLFAFTTMDDILEAVDRINSDYPASCRAAKDIARECFNYDVVLPPLLEAAGI